MIKEIEENKQNVKATDEKINKLEQALRARQDAEKKDQTARSSAQRILEDTKHSPSEKTLLRLRNSISEASDSTLSDIFFRALSTREKAALSMVDALDKITPAGFSPRVLEAIHQKEVQTFSSAANNMKAVIPIFEDLIASPREREFEHRYYAQLAYSKKDLLYCTNTQYQDPSKWSEVLSLLDKAIGKRNLDATLSGPNDPYSYYELNKAIVLIELDGKYTKGEETTAVKQAEIISLLEKAKHTLQERNSELKMIFPVNIWLHLNGKAKHILQSG